jgi:hypothetical protein
MDTVAPDPNGVATSPKLQEEFDWDGLKAAIDLQGGIRHVVIAAEMPQHPPIRLLRSVSEGIEPLINCDGAGRSWAGPQRDTPFCKD